MTDRRYGRNKYGDGKLYGASTDLDTLAWDISFDWDGDGLFESNENHHLIKVSLTRGRNGLLNENGIGFRNIPTGRCRLVLTNYDGRYNAWNTSSPIYPNVNYGVEVRVRVRAMNSSTIYPVFRGQVTNITPSGYGQRPTVDFTITDGIAYLRNTNARVSMQTNITVDEAIELVLASARYPWGRTLDTSSETIRYWWTTGDVLAMTEIEKLTTSFLGYFFADRNNDARFIGRATPYEPVAIFEQDELLKDIGNPQPYDIYRNVVRLKVHPRVAASTGTIFNLVGEIPSVEAGQTLILFCNYSYNNKSVPAMNVIAPVATTDYTMNTQSNGGGTNLTGSFTVTMTDFGETAKLSIYNGSGSLGYITLMKIRGDAIYETDTADVTYPEDTSTVIQQRELFIDLIWQQDINIALDVAGVQGAFWATLHPTPVIKMEARPDQQFNIELFDVVEVNLPALGLSYATYRVGGIEHETIHGETCQAVLSKFYLEPYIAAGDYMQWDINSVWDTDTVYGW